MRPFFILMLFILPVYLYSQVKQVLLHQNWKFRKVGDTAWMPAAVPGTVHTDLLANKKINDPFSYNENELQWIETIDWEYETSFSVDKALLQKKNIELQFDGLDTYANVYLNDLLVLSADNMFRSWNVEVKKHLKAANNVLRIVFTSAVNKGRELAKQLPYILPEGERVFTRKAQYQYGWDFAPRLVTCGIWKEVKLLVWDEARFEQVYVLDQKLSDTLAIVGFGFDINCAEAKNYNILIKPFDKTNNATNSILNTPAAVGINTWVLDYHIKDPKLWVPGSGKDAKLYRFNVQLLRNGKVLDERKIEVGLRKVELVQEKDEKGSTFYFRINNRPFFMKGANFVPPDIFLPRVKKENYRKIIRDAVEANMNMLRVWGGGTYADEEFYRLCDENGIMVWQDLMFACAMYPGDIAFTKNVKAEVEENIKRLAAHPCVVLWCGNNEIEEGWKNWGWQKQFKYTPADSARIYADYKNLFEKLIPDFFEENGLPGIYWPSSPLYGWGRKESLLEGDSHYWGVWWGMEPFEMYNNKVGRFMSEYGFQGMPSLACIKAVHPYEIKPTTAAIKSMQKYPKGFETIDTYLARDFKEGNGFEDYVYLSQLVQARGMQIAIEAHRRNKPYCMGSLYWQLNDCWPGITWSSVDHSGNWKAAHYSIKRGFENSLVSIVTERDSMGVWVISDMLAEYPANLTVKLLDLSGKELWSENKSVIVKPGEGKREYLLSSEVFKAYDKQKVFIKASLSPMVSTIKPAEANYYFVSPKDLKLEKPDLKISWWDKNTIEVSTNTLARNIFLGAGSEFFFDDNYFDLVPGEKKYVKVSGLVKKKKPQIRVITLADVN